MSAPYKCPGWASKPKHPAWLKVSKEGEQLERIALTDKALLFGRKVPNAPERGTLRLDHDSVSREHAAIVHAFNGAAFVVDLASRFGTTVNGTKAEPNKYIEIAEGAKLRFGASTREYELTRKAEHVASKVKSAYAAGEAPSAIATATAKAEAERKLKDRKAVLKAGEDEESDPMAEYEDEGDGEDDERGDPAATPAEKAARKEARRRERERRKEAKAQTKLERKAEKAEKKAEKKGGTEKGGKEKGGTEEKKKRKRKRHEDEGGADDASEADEDQVGDQVGDQEADPIDVGDESALEQVLGAEERTP